MTQIVINPSASMGREELESWARCRPAKSTARSAVQSPEGDISPSGLPQRREGQSSEVKRRPSWGTHQRHAKSNAAVDDARDERATISAAHVLMNVPEGTATQDAGFMSSLAISHRVGEVPPAEHVQPLSWDKDIRPIGCVSIPAHCRSYLLHRTAGFFPQQSTLPRLWSQYRSHRNWLDSGQACFPRDTDVHPYPARLFPTQPHSVG